MEGKAKTNSSTGDTSDSLLWPELQRPAKSQTIEDIDSFLWPSELINAKDRAAHAESHWPLTLATFSFIMASIFAFLIGPMQMILLAITKDYNSVTTGYYPTVLKAMLLCSGWLSIVNIVALVLAWKSRPRTARLTAVFVAGAAHIFSIGWVAAFLVTFQPNQLAITTLMAILIFGMAPYSFLSNIPNIKSPV